MHIRHIVASLLAVTILWAAAAQAQNARPLPVTPTAVKPPAATEPPPQKLSPARAAILGLVEGLTEYLPVSSTGHLILAAHYMGLTEFQKDAAGHVEQGLIGPKMVKNPAIDSFEVIIQFGAVLAVLGLYRRRVGQMASGLLGRNRDGRRLLGLLLVAFLPAAITGKLFHHQIEDHLFGPIPVIWAMAIGGVLILVVEHFFWRRPRNIQRITEVDHVQYWQALVIGLAQCLAMWPGTSRSMITMLAALVVGLDMLAAAEFSFLLALPTLGAATFYSGWTHRADLAQSAGIEAILIGLVVSGVVAAITVKVLVHWLTRHGLTPFGIYRIIVAAALYFVFTH